MAFESGVVPEDWRSTVIAPLYKGRGERNECKSIEIYVVRRVTGGFREGRGCVDHIFTLKQIGEKARDKKVECMWPS